uniref:Protein kinase domain-containing protein n=1 Tax=Oryzias melastigma TaxID=30732 RepID=A0A3B3BF58_ORYME
MFSDKHIHKVIKIYEPIALLDSTLCTTLLKRSSVMVLLKAVLIHFSVEKLCSHQTVLTGRTSATLQSFNIWWKISSDLLLHICIAFEILDKSLDDFMSDRDDRPLDLHEIRTIAWQLLIALQGLKNINLVHGDIKLDNIMLVNQVSEPFRVKLIDFGLAQKTSHIQTGSRMQNLLFRAPEVMLGLPLDERLDMWTVGYVLAMLYAGIYIHPQDSEYNIIRALVKMHGMPDNELLEQGERVEEHLDYFSFDDLRDVYYDMTKRDEVEQFIDLLKRMLEVDPNKRISPSEAFEHPFFTMKSVQPSAGSEEPKPEEPAAPEVHQQAETKEWDLNQTTKNNKVRTNQAGGEDH